VIATFIVTGRPVDPEESPATAGAAKRRDRAKHYGGLEEMGYLHQPHASAGRVPTDKAIDFM